MFEELAPAQRRQILFASRIRFGPEVEIPRQRAIDKIIENTLFVAAPGEWVSANEVVQAFDHLGGLRTLRVTDVEHGLSRVVRSGRAELSRDYPQYRYRLVREAYEATQRDYDEASARLDRVLTRLFGDVAGEKGPRSLAPFFLETICDFFSRLGAQWADYLSGQHVLSPVYLGTLGNLVTEKLEHFSVPAGLRAAIKRRFIQLFQEVDPDFDYLKFSLGQSFYVARLLGMEGKDYLSEEIFAGKVLYLDSSVIIPALLGSSRHYQVFQDLRKICDRLSIKLCVTRPTVDEVRNVAAEQEKIAPSLYDQIPENLSSRVRGDFFNTYFALKKNNPATRIEDLFVPFHDLAVTLRQELGIEVVDSPEFETIPFRPNFMAIKEQLQAASQTVRKRKKFANALVHDGQVFLFLDSEAQNNPDNAWFVTRDLSIPKAWSALQPGALKMRAFLLDGLLQSISPFVLADEDISDFAEVFSQVMAAQLLPQSRLFDVEDFQLFQDIELDCSELTEDEVQEGLLRVKKHVLHGASYRHEDLGPATYELRRFFTSKKDRVSALTKDRERLEEAVSKLEKVMHDEQDAHAMEISILTDRHLAEIQALGTRIKELEEKDHQRQQRAARVWRALKKSLALLILLVILSLESRLALRLGEGTTRPLKIISFWPYLTGSTLLWLLFVKTLLFPTESLKSVFPTWAEVKELFPFG